MTTKASGTFVARLDAAFKEWRWLAPIAFGVIVLGTWGFYAQTRHDSEPASPLTALFMAIQLFVLNSGNVGGPVLWQLELARWLAVIWVTFTVTSIVKRIASWRVRYSFNGHTIVCGLSDTAKTLLHDLRARSENAVVIERDAGNLRLVGVKTRGTAVEIGDAAEAELLDRVGLSAAKRVYISCGSDTENLKVFDAIRKRQPKAKLTISMVSPTLIQAVEHVAAKSKTAITIYNRYDTAARRVLASHPLDGADGIRPDDPTTVCVIIAGLGALGRAICLQAARISHFANFKKCRIWVIDPRAEVLKDRLLAEYPRLDHVCDISFLNGRVESSAARAMLAQASREEDSVVRIFICLDDDEAALQSAFTLPRDVIRGEVPTFVRVDDDAVLRRLADEGPLHGGLGHLIPFGVTPANFSVEDLLMERSDHLAKAIHESYVAATAASGRTAPEWENLPEAKRRANRQQADHIPVKLRAVGCQAVSGPQEGADDFGGFTPGEVDLLARMEHERWMAAIMLEGYEFGPVRDSICKTHPDLTTWENLDEPAKDKDRDAVRNIPLLLIQAGRLIKRISK